MSGSFWKTHTSEAFRVKHRFPAAIGGSEFKAALPGVERAAASTGFAGVKRGLGVWRMIFWCISLVSVRLRTF